MMNLTVDLAFWAVWILHGLYNLLAYRHDFLWRNASRLCCWLLLHAGVCCARSLILVSWQGLGRESWKNLWAYLRLFKTSGALLKSSYTAYILLGDRACGPPNPIVVKCRFHPTFGQQRRITWDCQDKLVVTNDPSLDGFNTMLQEVRVMTLIAHI